MRRAAGLALVLVGMGLLLGAPVPARAASPTVDRQAWSSTGPIVDPTYTPSDQNLYVTALLGTEYARSFAHVDLAGLTRDELRSLSLTFGEGSDGLMPETAVLHACALLEPLAASGRLPPDALPTPDCTLQTDGVRAADGTWTFALDVFLDRWLTQANTGLVIFPRDLAPPATYRVSFDTTRTALRADLLPPAAPAPAEGDGAAADAPIVVPIPSAPGLDLMPLPVPATPAPSRAAPTSGAGALPGIPRLPASANSPASVAVLLPLLLVGVAAVGGVASRPRRLARAREIEIPSAWLAVAARVGVALAFVALPPLMLDEPTVFRFGNVLIFIVAALGLHVLVNWAGQLSLAHAALIGLPAFVVGRLAVVHGQSPIPLLPLALVVGAVVGALVALPALRVRGLYVTIITLASGIAIQSFFFSRPLLVGTGLLSFPNPSLGPITFRTSASLYPLLAVVFLVVVVALQALFRSKVARAFFWIKSNPDAAAAAGVNVGAYTVVAYAVAGALAGLSGGLTAVWVQRLTAANFPLTLAFTYLIIAVLAGPGSIVGILATVFVLRGLPLFSDTADAVVGYVSPIALIVMLTRYPAGVNGLGRLLMARVKREMEDGAGARARLTALFLAGVGLIVVGLVAIGVAWYHTGNTDQTWVQLQELASGGVGGLALVIVGTALLIRDQVTRNVPPQS